MNPLRKIKRLLDKILGDGSDRLFWQCRHFFDYNWSKSYITEESLSHPHRKLLIEKISKYYPFENVLEVGSASGPNLYLLAEKFPEVKFYGIDVSGRAISEGKSFFIRRNKKNIFLQKAQVNQLVKFKDKNMDIVFSDATLLYVGLDKIGSVLENMVRIAKKAIILCEQHTDGEPFYDDKWVHNYRAIIGKHIPSAKVNFTKISKKLWKGDWSKYGYIIEVIL